MSNQSKRTTITNRQLNFTLSPVDLYNAKKMPYSLSNYTIDGTWNHHQSIILDVILDRLFKLTYSTYKNVPKSWRSPKVSNVASQFLDDALNPENLNYMSCSPINAYCEYKGEDLIGDLKKKYEISEGTTGVDDYAFKMYVLNYFENNTGFQFYKKEMDNKVANFQGDLVFQLNYKSLLKDYPFLNRYRYDFYKKIEKISDAGFKMNYKVKYIEAVPEYNDEGRLVKKGKLKDSIYGMREFQPIFLVEKNSSGYSINFKSPLGKFILHNTLILDTDWIPEDAFNLNKNTYFIYKRFILNRISGKNKPKEIRLWFEDIQSFLDMHWDNDPGIHAKFDKAFKEMRAKGLIQGYSWNKDYGQRQYCLSFESPKKGIEKMQDKGDEVMKLPAAN